jgi:oligopeptide transport system substrate-binding protein
MSLKKWSVVLGILVVVSMILTACPAPAPQVVEKVVTQVVEKQVVQTQVVEKEVQVVQTQVVEKQVEVVATPTALPKEAVLRVNVPTYPDVIDPQKSSFVNEIAHLQMMYQGLTTFNEKLETVPGAAEKWEYNDDATVLTFTVKEGLKYSDGAPLNAKRFEYALQRNIDPEPAGEYASITDEIKGAPEWRGADTAAEDYDAEKFKAELGVKATKLDGSECNADDPYADPDCRLLTLTLSKPAPYFHTIMGIWVAYPAREELITEGGENWWNSSKFQIGNGPFVLQTLEPFVQALFVPNPNFEGPNVPAYNLEYRYITDSAVAFEAYRNDEFDVVAAVAEDLKTIEADPDLKAQHVLYPGSCTIVIKLGLAAKYTDPAGNEYDSPFIDPKVREAFAYAFDAESWAKDVDQGLSTATWTWIPPGYPGYDPTSPMKFDPELAKTTLAESTFGGPEKLNALGMKITYGDTPRNRVRHEWLAANFKEHLGVDIALDPVDPTTWTALTKDPATFPLLARQGWCADYPDPQNWLSVYWKSDTTFAQRQGWKNEEFDQLVGQADVELDPAKRMELYKQAQQVLLAQFPSAFGYNTANSFLVKPWVKGYNPTPQDGEFPGQLTPWTITIDTAAIP